MWRDLWKGFKSEFSWPKWSHPDWNNVGKCIAGLTQGSIIAVLIIGCIVPIVYWLV